MKTAKILMLTLVATTLLAGGCAQHHGAGTESSYREAALERGLAETNDLVDRTVKDPEKAKQAKATVQDIVNEVKQSFKTTRDYHQKLYALNVHYEATPEQFIKVLDEQNTERMASATRILGLRFKLKALLTAEEWKDLTDAMNTTRSRYMPKKEGM
jgi:polyhydroxyalkanoate synthesis regulator phasin